ncbi:MAG: hypothetical protein NXI10_16740 [bacterium]|nr:hypothetical protein [bacterium]
MRDKFHRLFILVVLSLSTSYSFGQQARYKVRSWEVSAALGSNAPIARNDLIATHNNFSPSASLGVWFNQRMKGRSFFSTGLQIDYAQWSHQGTTDGDSILVFSYNSSGNSFFDQGAYDVFEEIEGTQMYSPTIVDRYTVNAVYITLPFRWRYYSRFKNFSRFFASIGISNHFKIYDWDGVTASSNALFGSVNSPEPFRFIDNTTLRFYYPSASLAIGYEWNFMGTSTLRFELDYNFNLTSIYKSNVNSGNMFLQDPQSSSEPFVFDEEDVVINKVFNNNIKLRIAVAI